MKVLLTLPLALACLSLSACDSATGDTQQAQVASAGNGRTITPLDLSGGGAPKPVQPSAEAPVKPAAGTTSGPKITFESLHKDFGKVPDTEDLIHNFVFKNTGDETLVISNVKPSCGCTTTELDRLVFDPGEGDSIDIDWEPKGHGVQSKTITVQSNSTGNPVLQLRISAQIEPFLRVEPPRADFQLAPRSKQNQMNLTITCMDPELEILEASGSTPDVLVTIVEPANAGRAVIQVAIAEQNPTQGVRRFFPKVKIRARARVQGKGEPIEHVHEVPVMATIYNEVAPDPAFFGVGRVLPGRSFKKEVKLTRPNGLPFSVLAAEVVNSTMPGVSVRVEPHFEAGLQGYKLTLEGASGDFQGPLRGRVNVTTDVPGDELLGLDFMGIVGPMPSK